MADADAAKRLDAVTARLRAFAADAVAQRSRIPDACGSSAGVAGASRPNFNFSGPRGGQTGCHEGTASDPASGSRSEPGGWCCVDFPCCGAARRVHSPRRLCRASRPAGRPPRRPDCRGRRGALFFSFAKNPTSGNELGPAFATPAIFLEKPIRVGFPESGFLKIRSPDF
eukprot:scaffold9021_cov118-Isochrysis_galbana.AAC.10